MNRKDYQTPTMKVVQLQHKQMLMGSNGSAGVQNYNWHTETEE